MGREVRVVLGMGRRVWNFREMEFRGRREADGQMMTGGGILGRFGEVMFYLHFLVRQRGPVRIRVGKEHGIWMCRDALGSQQRVIVLLDFLGTAGTSISTFIHLSYYAADECTFHSPSLTSQTC